jgi:hypothetical protein
MATETTTKMTMTAWIVQDVFSSGSAGPGYTVHETEVEAIAAALGRCDGRAAVFPARECPTCGSLIGLDGSLQGGCIDCR